MADKSTFLGTIVPDGPVGIFESKEEVQPQEVEDSEDEAVPEGAPDEQRPIETSAYFPDDSLDQTWRIRNDWSGLTLTTMNSRIIQQNPAKITKPRGGHNWTFKKFTQNGDSFYGLQATTSGRWLYEDKNKSADDSLWSSESANPASYSNARWQIKGSRSSLWIHTHDWRAHAFDVKDRSTKDNGRVILYENNHHRNQRWYIHSPP